MTVCLEPHHISLLSENQSEKTTYTLHFGKATFSINGQETSIVRIHLLTTRFKEALDALESNRAEIYGQRKGTNRLVSVGVE
jgi:pyruvate/2-oxoglutarate/acetoin dehydrogenase E1 component